MVEMIESGFEVFHAGRLRVAFEPQPGPLTGMTLAIRSGSRFDGDLPGIAHLAEHMFFQGTKRLDHFGINRRAAELGGDHDAYTGYEELNVTFQVLNEHVPEAIDLLADQALGATVPAERLESERQVVVQEIRGHRDDSISHLTDETWKRFFRGGLSHSPSGTLASVRGISPARVRRFLADRVVAPNVVLSVVGGVDHATLALAAKRSFAALEDGVAQEARGAARGKTGEVRFKRAGLTQLYWTTIIEVPSDARSLVALGMALDIVGTEPDGRLYHEIREKRALSYDLWDSLLSGAGWAAMSVGAVVDRRAEWRLRRTVDEVLETAAREGFRDDEIARVRGKAAYNRARLVEARLRRSASHADTLLFGAPSIAEAQSIERAITREEIEATWRIALAAPRLTGVLTGS